MEKLLKNLKGQELLNSNHFNYFDYACLDIDNKVLNVIKVKHEDFNHESFLAEQQILLPETFRIVPVKDYDNFATVGGFLFDSVFSEVKPYPNFVWSESEKNWIPPIPKPQDSEEEWFVWSPESNSWVSMS